MNRFVRKGERGEGKLQVAMDSDSFAYYQEGVGLT